MEIEKNDFISIIEQMYKNEKIYRNTLTRNAEMRQKIFELEKKVKYLKLEEYDVRDLESEVNEIKSELKTELQSMEEMKKGNITLFNWEYLNDTESNLYKYLLDEKFINHDLKKSIIKYSFDSESLNDVQNLIDSSKSDLLAKQSEEILQIIIVYDENATVDDIRILVLVEKNSGFNLLFEISYKDVIKFIVFNSDKEIVSSNLKSIKKDNFLLKLIKIITEEADSKTTSFNNRVNKSINELSLALDELFLEKQNDDA